MVIEKWEGPCWLQCLANSSATPPLPCNPACAEETHQLDTIARIKAVNPNVSTVFYHQTLYDFPFYNLTAQMAAADLHMRDINGSVIGLINDNGMQHVPLFDWGKPAAIEMFLQFHRGLISTGLVGRLVPPTPAFYYQMCSRFGASASWPQVDGMFPDKANERAFQRKSDGLYFICESPNGPPSKHTWADACAQITEPQATAYNAGKVKVLQGLHSLYDHGPLFPTMLDGVPDVVCSRREPCNLNLGTSVEAKHAQIADALKTSTYVYFMMGDGNNATVPQLGTKCTTLDVIKFLLILEEGCILGCNGHEPNPGQDSPPQSWWTNPLGNPLGPPSTDANGVATRKFGSGTVVTLNLKTNSGSIAWGAADSS